MTECCRYSTGSTGAESIRMGRPCDSSPPTTRIWWSARPVRRTTPSAAPCSPPGPTGSAGGRYSFAGADYQLPINEPARGHALHGVAFGLVFDVVEATPTRVRLAADVPPSQGWPFPMRLAVSYELDDDGLTIRLVGTNTGTSTCRTAAASTRTCWSATPRWTRPS
jgi:hypothetical protein